VTRSPCRAERRLPFPVTTRAALTGCVVGSAWLFLSVATAQAHLRSGTVAVDYRATLLSSGSDAYRASIYESDRALALTVLPGHSVVLIGYLGEPVFRLDGAGLAVNAASPTAAAVGLVVRSHAGAGTGRGVWRRSPGQRSVVWHDARADGLPLGVARGIWRVPVLVDGRKAWLQGVLRRFPAPSLGAWLGWLLALVLLIVGGARLGRGRLSRWSAGCAVAAAFAAVGNAFAVALDAYASPGTWLIALNELAFTVAGLVLLARGPRDVAAGAAAGLGLVGMAGGVLYGDVFLHSVVLAVLPATVVRLGELVAVGGGLCGAGLGGLLLSGQPPAPVVRDELRR
jgi:hypothetical protein